MDQKTKNHIIDVHHDLLMERMKVDVLISATEDTGSNTNFEEGIHQHLIDLSKRLQGLCDRLDDF